MLLSQAPQKEQKKLQASLPKHIANASNKFDSIAIFSHNPGLTDFANLLTATRIDNIPTCGIFAAKADCDKWKDFKEAKKEFWFFDYPKNL